MSMHHRIGENLGIEPSLPIQDVAGNPVILPGFSKPAFVDFSNSENPSDEHEGIADSLTDIETFDQEQ